MIIISNIRKEQSGNCWRLCSDINVDEEVNTIYYEVGPEYAEFLCDDRADAFLVGILPFAMAFKHNIIVKDFPVSEKLWWSLNHQYIPTLAQFSNFYNSIDIKAFLTNKTYNSNGVGTGFSAGVDSFFTVLKNLNQQTNDFNITHLTFFNVGANGSFGGEKAEKRFQYRKQLFEKFVHEMGLKFVTVNSNISEFIMMSYNYTHSFRSMSAVLALEKLFSKYYYSSDFALDNFSIDPEDSANFDLLNVQAFSTENTTFYSTGLAESRIDKMKYISDYPKTYDMLNVCNAHDVNCRSCEKCIRTMGGLYAINKLQLYNKVFDVEYFNAHLARNFGYIMARPIMGTTEAKYHSEIIKTARKNHVKIPISALLYAVPYGIQNTAYRLARSIKPLRKLVHKRISKQSGIRFNN